MRKSFKWSLMGLLVLTAWTHAIEVPLTYDSYGDPNVARSTNSVRTYQPRGFRMFEGATKLPEGDWKLPALKSKCPVYGILPLAGKDILLVLDKQKDADIFFTRLYCDRNGNKDLTDDDPVDMKADRVFLRSNNMQYANFPPMDLKVGNMPYSIGTVAYYRGEVPEEGLTPELLKSQNFRFYCMSNCCYRGAFKYKETSYSLILSDYNLNGRYDDVPENLDKVDRNMPPPFDMFFMSKNESITSRDRSFFCNKIVLDGSLFDIKIDLAAGKMILSPNTQPMVTVKSGMAFHRMTLLSAKGKSGVMVFNGGSTFGILPGQYKVIDYYAEKKDAQGDLWSIQANGLNSAKVITVGKGNDILPVGEPFKVQVQVDPGAYKRFEQSKPDQVGAVPLSFSIAGAAGEEVTDLRHLKGEKTKIPLSSKRSYRPKEPEFEITKANGDPAGRGSFEYG